MARVARLAALLALGLRACRAQLVAAPPQDPQSLLRDAAPEAPAPELTLRRPSLCDPSVGQHAGYFRVSAGVEYFFWLFESRRSPASDPLVLWLTGGPGCSSQLALLAENGPCSVNKEGTGTVPNPHSWNSRANVIWVDQPAGTGFSTGLPSMHNETQVGDNMYRFLQALLASEELSKFASRDLYVFGESYAGHYIPAVTHRIWQGGKRKEGVAINLKGMGIGNGLTDPAEQYKWYAQMAADGGKAEGGSLEKGVITSAAEIAAMKAASVVCTAAISQCNSLGGAACTAAYATCNYGEVVPYQLTGMNPYDMRIKCEHGKLCYDFGKVDKYLNSKEVQEQLGVRKSWSSCNMLVNVLFQQDWMHNYHTLLPEMLAGGIRVLIYAGDVDYICNWLGNKKWTLALEWPGKDGFNAAEDKAYVPRDAKASAGRLRSYGGLSFMQVYQAGHMVPMDQPEVALDMLDAFVSNGLEERAGQAAEEVLI